MSFAFDAKLQERNPNALLSINCLVQGDVPLKRRAFTVKITGTDNVSILKEVIKSKLVPRFDHVAANEFDLWKVDIPLDGSDNKLAALEADATVDIEQVLGGEEMLALCEVGEYFDSSHSQKLIHVIVKQCSPGETHHSTAMPISPVSLPLNGTANPLVSATNASNVVGT